MFAEKSATPPFHMISMSTKICHNMLSCQTDPYVCTPMSLTIVSAYVFSINVKFNHYKKTGSSGVKGRVRSNSIYIENLKLVGSVQRVSNPGQKVKFNQYKKTGSSGVNGWVRSNSINIEILKSVGSV